MKRSTEKATVLCTHRCALRKTHLTPPRKGSCRPYRLSFLKRPGWRFFRAVLAGLRTHCPAAMPVVVRTSRLSSDTLGGCARRRKRFVITLNLALDEPGAVDTLLHEWGHALAWNLTLDRLSRQAAMDPEDFQEASHDEAWGCAYSRVWRVYIGHILPNLASD